MHRFYLYTQLLGLVFLAFDAGWAFDLHRHGVAALCISVAIIGVILHLEFWVHRV
jgi:hypothetical protein